MFKGPVQTSIFMSLLCFTSIGYANSNDQLRQIAAAQKEAVGSESCGHGPKHMRVSARHIEGKGIGYNQGYTTLETFLAPDPESFSVMPFLDLRGHVFDNGKFAANVGVGARWRWGCRAYGANAYYDYRDDRKGFNQVGLGLESLGERWDFRINGYLPVGNKISRPYQTRFSHFKGNRLILSRKYEFTMKGVDAEAGAHVDFRNFNFFAGAGPYYFDGEIGPHAWGGKGRLFGMWKEYIGLELSASYDNVFNGIVQGQIFFSLPFGPRSAVKASNKHCQTTCGSAKALDRRMVQPVIRDEVIVLNKHRKHSTAIDPATGDPFLFWFVDNTSHSAGTFESPFNMLVDAQNAAGQGDSIYVFPGDLTSTGMSSGITLKNGQQLLGATMSHSVVTTVGAITIPPQASGNYLPMLANGSGPVVTLANNNVVSGLYIQNLAGQGLLGSAINNVTATRNFIQGSGSFSGVELDNATGTATLSNNTIMNELYCVYINNTAPVSNATYSLTNNIIDNNDEDYGVLVSYTEGSNNSFVFSDNQITGGDEYGVYVECTNTTPNTAHTFNFSNNQIQVADLPIYITTSGTTFNSTITGNTLVSGEYGFYYYLEGSSNATGTASNNTVNGLYYLGAVELTQAATFSGGITNNIFNTWADDPGIYVYADTTSAFPALNISNNTLAGGYYGVYIENTSSSTSSISCTNNSFSLQSAYGIFAENNGSGNLNMNISSNTFKGFGLNAVDVLQNMAGTICLELNYNTANPLPNAYLLHQTGATFNLVTPVGNVGQLTEMGTTPVSSCP